jgi:mono/diheme cytochrome c family protein
MVEPVLAGHCDCWQYDMRAIARLFVVSVVALAMVLAVRFDSRLFPTAKITHKNPTPQVQRIPATKPKVPREPVITNQPAEPATGFYVGNGDQRVFVNYATPDPVLRSFIQSVMDGSLDPKAKGREIFLRLCAACHQPDGGGKEGVAPPLVGSDWALAPGGGRLVRIVLNGLTGPVQVRGKTWNLSMPPWRENLSDDQIAVVLTFVRSELGNNHAGPIASEFVASARKETRTTMETSDELLRISDQ